MKENYTTVSEFILVGLPILHGFRIPIFILLLIIYIGTNIEHILIILLVSTTLHLKSPMYLILKHVSICQMVYAANFHPMILHFFIYERATISVTGCFAHLATVTLTSNTLSFQYALMSYDRYLAISKPLEYSNLIDKRLILRLIVGFWIISWISVYLKCIMLLQLEFCGHAIENFYCEYNQVLELSCSGKINDTAGNYIVNSLVGVLPLIFGIISNVFIIYTIMRIPSTTAKRKAFYTCSAHFTMFGIIYVLFIGGSIWSLISKSPNGDRSLTFVYITTFPFVSPIVLALKNQEIHRALKMKVNAVKMLYNF